MVEGGPSPGISTRPVGSTEQMEEPLGHDPLRLEDYGEGWELMGVRARPLKNDYNDCFLFLPGFSNQSS